MRLLIDESIELNTLDEKNFAGAIERMTWLAKHAPGEPISESSDLRAKFNNLTTAAKAEVCSVLLAEVLAEIKVK